MTHVQSLGGWKCGPNFRTTHVPEVYQAFAKCVLSGIHVYFGTVTGWGQFSQFLRRHLQKRPSPLPPSFSFRLSIAALKSVKVRKSHLFKL